MNPYKMTFSIVAATVCTLATSANAATPISGTGFSRDVFAENSGAASPNDVTDHNGFGSWKYPEAGTPNFPVAGTAFPTAGGSFVSKNATPFQLQALNQNNVLLSGDTFTLDTPARYGELRFLTTGIGGNTANNFQATVNFADTSSTLFQFGVSDWQASRTYNASDTRFMIVRNDWNTYFTNGVFLRELVFDLSLVDEAKTINSIDFTLGDRLGLSAISGELLTAVPEPSSTALLGLGGLALLLRRRR